MLDRKQVEKKCLREWVKYVVQSDLSARAEKHHFIQNDIQLANYGPI